MNARNRPDPLDNPVVEEIREIRARLWREGGSTGAGLLRLIRERTQSRQREERKDIKRPRRKAG